MRIGFTRHVLAVLLSLALVDCASSNNSEPRSQTSDISGEQFACSFANFSSIVSSPCASSDSQRTAYLAVQTTPERARKECRELADFASSQVKFQPHWTLEITSPDSDGGSCTLQLPSLSDVPTPLWPVIEEVLLFAISIYPQEANEFLQVMISLLEQMRTHLGEMTQDSERFTTMLPPPPSRPMNMARY
jgi:hypothetical protein